MCTWIFNVFGNVPFYTRQKYKICMKHCFLVEGK